MTTAWPNGTYAEYQSESQNIFSPNIVDLPNGAYRNANEAEKILCTAVGYWNSNYYVKGDRFWRNLGTARSLLDMRLGSALTANTNDPTFVQTRPRGHMYMTGTTNNSISVPHETALSSFSNNAIDIRVNLGLVQWAVSPDRAIINKFNGSSGLLEYILAITSTGTLQFGFSTTGTNYSIYTSTAAVTTRVSNDNDIWIRATHSFNTPAEIKFYTSPDGTTWTQLGTTVASTSITSYYAGTEPVYIGSQNPSSYSLNGRLYNVIIKNGINGTDVLNIDCDVISFAENTTFLAQTGQTVTINRSNPSTYPGKKWVTMPANSDSCFVLGTDDYFQLLNSAEPSILFDNTQPFTIFSISRKWPGNYGLDEAIVAKKQNSVSSTGIGWSHGYYQNAQNDTWYSAQTCGTDNNSFSYSQVLNYPSDGKKIINISRFDVNNRKIKLNIQGLEYIDRYGNYSNIFGSPYNRTINFRIGRSNTTADQLEAEIYVAAVFRRLLTNQEIKILNDYFIERPK